MQTPPASPSDSVLPILSAWSGGPLCIDFTNTLGRRLKGGDERFGVYSDLLSWSVERGAFDEQRSISLQDRASLRPAEAAAALDRALELRECLYRLFGRIAARENPDDADLTLLNRALSKALPHRKLYSGPNGLSWDWGEGENVLERMLWPIAYSAAELLVSPEATHIRRCSAPDCHRLFVDRSRTRRRRWCDMKTCGNRNKARRLLARRRREAAASSSHSSVLP